jgi:general stress protein 26
MTTYLSPADALGARIASVRIAMLTTVDADGHLVAHPMTRQDIDPDGNLWFFTSDASSLWQHVAAHAHVNVSFANPDDYVYVSVSGHAEQVRDRDRMRQLWNPFVAAWFPDGVDDPHLALIRVHAHTAEYWDAHGGRMVQLFRMAKAAVTGHPPRAEPGEHGTLHLN